MWDESDLCFLSVALDQPRKAQRRPVDGFSRMPLSTKPSRSASACASAVPPRGSQSAAVQQPAKSRGPLGAGPLQRSFHCSVERPAFQHIAAFDVSE